jgi:aryl-alcohol dehydrogenase-like predicted oxidoreductase
MKPSMPQNDLRLGLGTVQFGMDYGITNEAGQVSEAAVEEILALAADSNVRVIDTAALYGTSEAVLGRMLPCNIPWRIVSKTPKFSGADGPAAAARLTEAFNRSLELLRRDSIYGLLVHDVTDLLGPQAPHLWAAMKEIKAAGKVQKIGASIYTGAEADRLLDQFDPDLLQLPFNAVDQRLAKTGVLERLAARGVEIHSRSTFLQGLLIAPPESIAPRFGALRDAVGGLAKAFADLGLTPIEGALAAVLKRPEIGCVIVGVTSLANFRAIIAALQKVSQSAQELAIERWTVDDDMILNPAKWPFLAARS